MVKVYCVYACLGLSILQASHDVPNFDISPRWLDIPSQHSPVVQVFSPVVPLYLHHRPGRIQVTHRATQDCNRPLRPINPDLEELRRLVSYDGPLRPDEGEMVSRAHILAEMLCKKGVDNEISLALGFINGRGGMFVNYSISNNQVYMNLFDKRLVGVALLSAVITHVKNDIVEVYIREFLRHLADPNGLNDSNGDTPLLTVVKSYANHERSLLLLLSIMDLLVHGGANPLLLAGQPRQTPRQYAEAELRELLIRYNRNDYYWDIFMRRCPPIKKLLLIIDRLAQLEKWYNARELRQSESASGRYALMLPQPNMQEPTDVEIHIRASCLLLPEIKRLRYPWDGRLVARGQINNRESEVRDGRHVYAFANSVHAYLT